MKIHLRKGFTLVLVIFVLAILMILATFTLTFMVNENSYAIYHENATKAEYIAMNGADIVEAALISHLKTLFEEGQGIDDVNAYLNSLKDIKKEVEFSTIIEGLEKVEISVIKINETEVLAIDSFANYNGVSKSVRKILWSDIGVPLIVKNEAYLIIKENGNKDKKVDLTSPTNGKIYAKKMVDSYDFPLFSFPPDPPEWNGNMKNLIPISGEINEDMHYNGNVLINGDLTIKKGVKISVRGNLIINANIENTGTGDDVNFYVYNEGNKETALEIDPPHKGKVNANFYVKQGKIDISLKQAKLNGDIVSNDKFSGVINNGNLNQKDYNIKLIAEDNSKKINFNGSIYAPEAYILIGGSIESNDKNAINQNGVIVGSYIEINGRNENKNDYFIDNIYNNFIKAEGIELPVGTSTEYSFLNYFSYYIDY